MGKKHKKKQKRTVHFAPATTLDKPSGVVMWNGQAMNYWLPPGVVLEPRKAGGANV